MEYACGECGYPLIYQETWIEEVSDGFFTYQVQVDRYLCPVCNEFVDFRTDL